MGSKTLIILSVLYIIIAMAVSSVYVVNKINKTKFSRIAPELFNVQKKICIGLGYGNFNELINPTQFYETENGKGLIITCMSDNLVKFNTDAINYQNRSITSLQQFWVQVKCENKNCSEFVWG